MLISSTVTSKGQVLIPAVIRNKLNIKPFDRVIFNISGSKIVAERAVSTNDMYGIVKTKKRFTNRQLEKAIGEAAKEGFSKGL